MSSLIACPHLVWLRPQFARAAPGFQQPAGQSARTPGHTCCATRRGFNRRRHSHQEARRAIREVNLFEVFVGDDKVRRIVIDCRTLVAQCSFRCVCPKLNRHSQVLVDRHKKFMRRAGEYANVAGNQSGSAWSSAGTGMFRGQCLPLQSQAKSIAGGQRQRNARSLRGQH
jgi:hypothetical protein